MTGWIIGALVVIGILWFLQELTKNPELLDFFMQGLR
jgi:hypothetical protein